METWSLYKTLDLILPWMRIIAQRTCSLLRYGTRSTCEVFFCCTMDGDASYIIICMQTIIIRAYMRVKVGSQGEVSTKSGDKALDNIRTRYCT